MRVSIYDVQVAWNPRNPFCMFHIEKGMSPCGCVGGAFSSCCDWNIFEGSHADKESDQFAEFVLAGVVD